MICKILQWMSMKTIVEKYLFNFQKINKSNLSQYDNEQDITLDENIYITKNDFDINNLTFYKNSLRDRESKKILIESKLLSHRESFNQKKQGKFKNSLTETSLANFSKRKIKSKLNSERSKFSQRQSHKGVNIDFEKNVIFSTMNYTKKSKPKPKKMFSNIRKKTKAAMSTSRDKKKLFGFQNKKTFKQR